jgi:lipopolysaccharide export system protein LptA
MEIHRLTAETGVIISSQGNVATGEKAVYDVVSGKAVMTGGDLTLTSPDQTVTAQERFEYDVKAGRLSAHGNAVVTRLQDKLSADHVSAQFEDNKAQGKRTLKELTADGNVVIVTPTETVRGQKGVYRADTNIATLKGGVRIERGPNVLEGDEAEVNLTTNVSRMIGGATTEGGRVRGVFYPGSTDNGSVTPVTETPAVTAPTMQPAPPAPLPAPAPQNAPVRLIAPGSMTAP